MSQLQNIEQQFNFRYPALYHQLLADGMLDWGTFGPDWMSQYYPVLRKNPPLLLFANDFELIEFDEIKEKAADFADPDYWMQVKSGLQFIPFAQNGAGDNYCFFLNAQEGEDIPVVFMWHDANRAEFRAKNLQDFIFRSMLEAVAAEEEADYGLLGTDNFKEDLLRFLRTHKKYLSEKQQQIIERVYTTEKTNLPLIDGAQLAIIIDKEIRFEKLDMEFPYQ
ncbi:MAG TPA: SMI1/KNR4 family protein [Chitinophaga sp.]|nr:SMI1/KNR4 family protein [Chitinophaga sp.]